MDRKSDRIGQPLRHKESLFISPKKETTFEYTTTPGQTSRPSILLHYLSRVENTCLNIPHHNSPFKVDIWLNCAEDGSPKIDWCLRSKCTGMFEQSYRSRPHKHHTFTGGSNY